MEFTLETYDSRSQVESFINRNGDKKFKFLAAELSIKCVLRCGDDCYASSNMYVFFAELVDDVYTVFCRTPLN